MCYLQCFRKTVFNIRVKATGNACVFVGVVLGGGVDLAVSSIRMPGQHLSMCLYFIPQPLKFNIYNHITNFVGQRSKLL
jgi:hypothetical protein